MNGDIRREWFDKDYYQALGVPKNAPTAEIRKVYRKLAQQFHPDRNRGNKEAEERFKEISAAYEVLGDSEKRKQYDQVRDMGASGFAGFGGPGGAPSVRRLGRGARDGAGGGAPVPGNRCGGPEPGRVLVLPAVPAMRGRRPRGRASVHRVQGFGQRQADARVLGAHPAGREGWSQDPGGGPRGNGSAGIATGRPLRDRARRPARVLRQKRRRSHARGPGDDLRSGPGGERPRPDPRRPGDAEDPGG